MLFCQMVVYTEVNLFKKNIEKYIYIKVYKGIEVMLLN